MGGLPDAPTLMLSMDQEANNTKRVKQDCTLASLFVITYRTLA